MRKADVQVAVNMTGTEEGKEPVIDTQIEFLPCLFPRNVESTNKHIYFDPLVKQTEGGDKLMWETSLQGRRLVGRQH